MSAEKIVCVDGYNVIHAIEYLKGLISISLEAARDGLIKYSQHWISQHPDFTRIVIVFDGDSTVGPHSNTSPNPKIIVRYTPTGVEADEAILNLLKTHTHGKTRLVTDDMELVRLAVGLGAERLSPQRFYQTPRLSRSKKRSIPIPDKKRLSPKEKNDITRELEDLWCPEE